MGASKMQKSKRVPQRRRRDAVGALKPQPDHLGTAPRLWVFFDRTGRLLTATDYEAGLNGTEHGLSFHHVGPFTRVEYVPVVVNDAPGQKPLRPSK